jgi:hypothetical protein
MRYISVKKTHITFVDILWT